MIDKLVEDFTVMHIDVQYIYCNLVLAQLFRYRCFVLSSHFLTSHAEVPGHTRVSGTCNIVYISTHKLELMMKSNITEKAKGTH